MLNVRNLLVSSTDLRSPVLLEKQLMENDLMDSEVRMAMAQLLKVKSLSHLKVIVIATQTQPLKGHQGHSTNTIPGYAHAYTFL